MSEQNRNQGQGHDHDQDQDSLRRQNIEMIETLRRKVEEKNRKEAHDDTLRAGSQG